MARSGGGGGGMGFVVAVVVMLIVLVLAAKAWNVMLPEAAQAVVPGLRPAARGAADPNAQPASATRPSGMPDLKEMGQNTDRHIQAVQDATAKQD